MARKGGGKEGQWRAESERFEGPRAGGWDAFSKAICKPECQQVVPISYGERTLEPSARGNARTGPREEMCAAAETRKD